MKTSYFLISVLFCALCYSQSIWTVDNRPGTQAQFSNLQAAADAAEAGDILYVHPSPNTYGNLNINKELHVRGMGHFPELANGEHAIVNLITLISNGAAGTNASNSTISGLNIGTIQDNNSAQFINILIQNNRITGRISVFQAFNWIIQGNVFNLATGSVNGLIAFTNSNHGNNLIANNVFSPTGALFNSANNGLILNSNNTNTFINNLFVNQSPNASFHYFANCNNPVVSNNIFVQTSSASATEIETNNSTISFQNNITFDYGGGTLAALSGSGNLNNTNPEFTSLATANNPAFDYANIYKLAAGSAGINAGTDGSDIGIYGISYPFQMRGYPMELPYPTSIFINNAVVEAGASIEVHFTAEANIEQ